MKSASGNSDKMPTKIIWMYWQQGWDHAPELVKQCAASWRLRNPDYEIHLLDQHSVVDYISYPEEIDFQRKKLTVQKISNLTRLGLLSKYGGAWADASVFCMRPLSDWLDEYATIDFFVFRYPNVDKLLVNWFIAAEPNSLILQRLTSRQLAFFAENTFSNQGTRWGKYLVKVLSPRWNRDYRSTANWLSWFTRKVLRVYPYYIFYYIFNQLILADPECAAQWNAAKPLLAKPAQRLRIFSRLENGVDQALEEIASRATPMYKLNWRSNITTPYWSAVLRALPRD